MTDAIVGLIGGSGLGDELGKYIDNVRYESIETPFGSPSGDIMLGAIAGCKVAFLNRHGDGHRYSPSTVPYAANIFAMKKLGVHTLIATAAVGSLQEKNAPGDLVIVDQFIDKTFRRQNTFFDEYGAVHCEMARPVCSRLSNILFDTAQKNELKSHAGGTYVCMEGPQFSTRAESLMHRSWGGDLIGMTAMPEAKLAREAQMCYALAALVSDYDCWKPADSAKDKQTLLEEIIGNLKKATDNCLALIEAVLKSDADLTVEDCPCRKSLSLAVWTQSDKIDANVKEDLKILFE